MFEEYQAQIRALSGDYDFWVALIIRKGEEKKYCNLAKTTAYLQCFSI